MHNSLLEIFESTFDDRKLSSSERKALSEVLNDKDLDSKDLNYLRNRVFEFAKGELKSYSSLEVINWLEKVNKVLVKYQQKEVNSPQEDEIYFSPGEECRKAIIRNLHSAEKEILICVFTISDNKISDEIFKLYKKGVKIRIITDDDKTWDKGSDIYFLAKEGLNIRTDETPDHMHHKFALIDEKILMTGSYNWTRSAALYNYENILVTQHKKSILAYKNEFEKLWTKFVAFKK